ncbi:MAG TPA: hypothetical protein VMY18_00135, partial [Acidobacteriota bacterium]|nr:hypothetical protein [Acidobacteriota bacterium]
APGSDPLDEPSSLSGTLRSNSGDQSPERSDGTTAHVSKCYDTISLPARPHHSFGSRNLARNAGFQPARPHLGDDTDLSNRPESIK